jgi:hypothetical protein
MNRRTNTSQNSSHTNRQIKTRSNRAGIVFDVVLNEDFAGLSDTDSENFSTGKDTSVIGSVIARETGDVSTGESGLKLYRPLDPLDLDIPLIGETVELVSIGSVKYYRRIPASNLNKGNAKENFNKRVYPITEKNDNNAQSYSTTSQTGIANSNQRTERDTKLGEYFQEIQVNPLRMYEGDKLIQSRYGQSIRFSGYNNPENQFAPTIHIRNRQNDVSIDQLESGDITEEDVNRDGSTILITSGQYKIPFQPGVVDDGGSSNFDSKPEVFEDYPEELVGLDQVLINSGRIILSAKAGEMIFYSKGNYGFISDGKLSIDNGKEGANLNFNGDVRVTTNDNSFYILGETGNIFLNTEETTSPLVRGNVLKELLTRMIDLITKQVYQTPAGPTAPGPTNQTEFNRIKSDLDRMLSGLNYTDPE